LQAATEKLKSTLSTAKARSLLLAQISAFATIVKNEFINSDDDGNDGNDGNLKDNKDKYVFSRAKELIKNFTKTGGVFGLEEEEDCDE
jgi:hypothetical protein